MYKSGKLKSVHKSLLIIALILITFTACESPPEAPLRITDISVSPDPLIGQTVKLHIEFISSRDEKDVVAIVDLPVGVKLMSGELEWKGSLKANRPQIHEVFICVLYQGDWRIEVITASILSEGGSYSDKETVRLIVSENTAQVVPGGEYRYTQPTGGIQASTPTPLPKVPASLCPNPHVQLLFGADL